MSNEEGALLLTGLAATAAEAAASPEAEEAEADTVAATPPPPVVFKPPNELAWDARVEELLEYKQAHGDCDVPNTFEENPSLARWVGDQRRSYRRGTMAQHRVDRLNEIGFLWNKDRKAPWEVKWDKRFDELKNYMYKYGQIGVTLNGNVHPQWHALNEWATVQRKRYKDHKLREDLVERLNSIDFLWDTDDFVWDKHFRLLVQVQTHHKNPDDASSFRKWVSKQRELYHEGALAHDRVAKLNSVQFHWGGESGGSGENADGGGSDSDSPSPVSRSGGPQAHHRRVLKRGGAASSSSHGGGASHAGGGSDQPALSWDEHVKALAKYKRQHGDCHVPPEYTDHPTLAAWCKEQRALYRKKELAPERVSRLKKMGFRWANRKLGPKATWDERFEQLCELLREHRGMEGLMQYAAAAESLRRKTEEPSLLETIMSWVDYQRVLRKHSKLDPDKVERLTSVGLVWDAHQAAWDARFKQLVQHVKHGVKPRDYASYVKWEHRQRREHRLGTLHPDRVDRLNSVGFRWEPRPQRRRSSVSHTSLDDRGHTSEGHPPGSDPTDDGAGGPNAEDEDEEDEHDDGSEGPAFDGADEEGLDDGDEDEAREDEYHDVPDDDDEEEMDEDAGGAEEVAEEAATEEEDLSASSGSRSSSSRRRGTKRVRAGNPGAPRSRKRPAKR